MALSSFVGSFVQPGSTGNQSVTGVGFQPKALIFFFNYLPTDGSTSSYRQGWGLATSSSNRAAISSLSSDNFATSNGTRYHTDAACIVFTDGSGSPNVVADLVTMDSDGFTVNWSVVDAFLPVINYIALGGSDLTNAYVKQFTSNTSTGNQSITGVGFRPDSIFTMATTQSGAPPAFQSIDVLDIGFAISSSSRAAIGVVGNRTSPGTAYSIQNTDAVLIGGSNGGVIFEEADLVSMDSDGFTVNWSTVNGTARYHYALCLKGGMFKVGSFNQATATGNQAITGVGFRPSGLVVASYGRVTNATLQQDTYISFGAAVSSSARGSTWFQQIHNQNPTVIDSNLDRTKVIKMMTAGTPTTEAVADYVSNDSDGFTINWTTADATAREILYFAFGSAAAGTIGSRTISGSRTGAGSRTGSGSRLQVRDFASGLSFNGSASNYALLKSAASGGIIATLPNSSVSFWYQHNGPITPTLAPALYCERGFTGSDIYKVEIDGNIGHEFKIGLVYRDDANILSRNRWVVPTRSGWTHIVVTRSNASIVCYGNATQLGVGLISVPTAMTNTLLTRLGGDASSVNPAYRGMLDDVSVFNKTLTSDEVSDIYYNNTFPGTGLISRWKLDEGSGILIADTQGTNNATLFGQVDFTTSTRIKPRIGT
jgi:hypothetical protein